MGKRAAVLIAVALSATACTHARAEATGTTPSASATTVTRTASPAPSTKPPAHTLATISVGPQPDGMDAAYGSIWVTEHHNYAVQRINPNTNKVIATVTVGSNPSEVFHGFGAEWVLDYGDSYAWRIDPTSNKARKFSVGGFGDGAAAAGFGSLWISVDNGGESPSAIHQIDAKTLHTTKIIKRPCTYNCFLTVRGGLLWVSSQTDSPLWTYDPKTNAWRTVSTRGNACSGSIGNGIAYVSGTTRSGTVLDTIVPVHTPTGATDPAVHAFAGPRAVIDDGHVWIVNGASGVGEDGRIQLLDPTTMHLSTYTNLHAQVDSQCGGAIAAFGSLWVADWNTSVVYRIAEPS